MKKLQIVFALVLAGFGYSPIPSYSQPPRIGTGSTAGPFVGGGTKPNSAAYCRACNGYGAISARFVYRRDNGTSVTPRGLVPWRRMRIQGGMDYCEVCNVVGWVPSTAWTGPARTSWPTTAARTTGRIQEADKVTVNNMGLQHGCHSCGRKRAPGTPTLPSNEVARRFTPDHTPPVSSTDTLVYSVFAPNTITSTPTPGVTWALGPHCRVCYNRQGGMVSRANSERNAVAITWYQAAADYDFRGIRRRGTDDTKSLRREHRPRFRDNILSLSTYHVVMNRRPFVDKYNAR